eukprot:1982467-Rhodomonas_salina.1
MEAEVVAGVNGVSAVDIPCEEKRSGPTQPDTRSEEGHGRKMRSRRREQGERGREGMRGEREGEREGRLCQLDL